MPFEATFNKKQLTHFVLDRFFEQAEWKKNYNKDDLKCFWTTNDEGEEILMICPKKISKASKNES